MNAHRSSWLVVLASLLVSAGCPSNPPAKEPTTKEPGEASGPGFRFAWRDGDIFDLVLTKQVAGDSLEVRTRGVVKADGDKLRVTFDPVKLADKEKKAAAPGKSHAFIDVWPVLVVDKKQGQLIAIEGDLPPAAKDVVTRRWMVWTGFMGIDIELGTERSFKAEVEVGDGLLVPVRVTERFTNTPELGHKLEITRIYEGEQTKKLWQVQLADRGAPKAAIDAVQQASREEKLMIQTDPKNMHHRRIEEQSTYTVTTLVKKAESVDVYTELETWVFTWTR